MTNEQAIAELQKERDLIQGELDLDGSQFAPALLEALAMAIEALKAQNMILYMNLPEVSAEEVVEILKRNNRIELLPSAQPEQPVWAKKVDEYRKSAPSYIVDPLAWALYQVWKEYDEKNVKR